MAKEHFDLHLAQVVEDVTDMRELLRYKLDEDIEAFSEIGEDDPIKSVFDRVDVLVGYFKTIEGMLHEFDEMGRIFNHLMQDVAGEGCAETVDSGTGLRTIHLTVTEGMLNNSMLTLTSAKREGLVKLGEEFVITTPDGEPFKTTLVHPGNRLKERGRIRKFYESADVKTDDSLELRETEVGRWILEKVDYQTRRQRAFEEIAQAGYKIKKRSKQ